MTKHPITCVSGGRQSSNILRGTNYNNQKLSDQIAMKEVMKEQQKGQNMLKKNVIVIIMKMLMLKKNYYLK